MNYFEAPISEEIWDMKYRMKEFDGTPIDEDVVGTWKRVAKALSRQEKDSDLWMDVFYKLLEDFKFLPAGRITSGAGTGRNVTLFNCFVMGTIEDSMGGIFDALKEAALTMQQGGGIGYDFSTLRPKGAEVKGVAAAASGPLTFMDTWDAMCRTIMSAGSRRGAMMGTMRVDHPDIMDFIKAKADPLRLRMFNLSVLVTDKFMEGLDNGEDIPLVFDGVEYGRIPAQEIWDAIMQSTYAQAEPGVIFIDRINEANNLWNQETIAATNPCGEQPLPPYGACLLGSQNLTKYVNNPFTEDAWFDYKAFEADADTACRLMDNVIDVSKFPLTKQAEEAYNKRRIGVGITGLADALAMLGMKYGSGDSTNFLSKLLNKQTNALYAASALLAKEKGTYPLFDIGDFKRSEIWRKLEDDTKALIESYGLRNSHLTSIAPTGTISLYANNISSGIEPIFAYSYTRKVLLDDGSHKEQVVKDYAVAKYQEMFPGEKLPDHFVSAQELRPLEHLDMQAAAQYWVDSAISKTINCPADIEYEEFKDVYFRAWKWGCKGCTTYRPNDITGSVLTVSDDAYGKDDSAADGGACYFDPETGMKSCAD